MEILEYNGQELTEDQWLLKIRKDNMGFMTKLTKKGELPKAFDEWSDGYYRNHIPIPIKVISEDFSDGWSLNEGSRWDMYRIGKSQQWVKVKHPAGYVLEIHMENFFTEVVPFLENGKINGEYKWVGNQIVRRDED